MDAQTARRLLGVSENASVSEIERAFRKKSALYHPDKFGQDGGELQTLLTDAKDRLLNQPKLAPPVMSTDTVWCESVDPFHKYMNVTRGLFDSMLSDTHTVYTSVYTNHNGKEMFAEKIQKPGQPAETRTWKSAQPNEYTFWPRRRFLDLI